MFLPGKTQSHNLTKEEWEAMCNVVEDQSLIINPAYKSSRVGIWDREDYIAEGYRQRNDHSTYTDVKKFNQKLMFDLTDKINKIFKDLCNKKFITEKELEYFSFSFKNACCLNKMFFLPKIHKRLFDVPGRPVISNCETPTEKVSEFLDHHLQPVMKGGSSYVKDTQDFLKKLKHLGKVSSYTILVTADVLGLYLSIPHPSGLQALYKKLEERVQKKIPSSDLVNMAEFVLKINYCKFDCKVKAQISGTAIGSKLAPPFACMNKVVREFLEEEDIKLWIWLRYIDDIFFIWT